MEFTYELTADDYLDGFRAYRKRNAGARWLRRGLLVLGIFVLAIVFFSLALVPSLQNLLNMAPLIVLPAIWLAFLVIQPKRAARKQLASTPSSRGPIHVRVTEEGMEKKGMSSEAQTGWNSYVAWEELDTSFVLFSSPQIFYVYPKRAFNTDQITEFRKLLQQHLKR